VSNRRPFRLPISVARRVDIQLQFASEHRNRSNSQLFQRIVIPRYKDSFLLETQCLASDCRPFRLPISVARRVDIQLQLASEHGINGILNSFSVFNLRRSYCTRYKDSFLLETKCQLDCLHVSVANQVHRHLEFASVDRGIY
jgi:hypothetical protein